MKKTSLIVLITTLLLACKSGPSKDLTNPIKVQQSSAATQLIQKSIDAHGGSLYDKAHFSFVFRKNTYTFKNKNNSYTYTRTIQKGDSTIIDRFENGKIKRTVNNQEINLTPKQKNDYIESINSVIYFATLPHKLNDTAVNAKIVGQTTIKGKSYDVVEITFDQEGGGQDYKDQYYYWINQSNHKIDYLAYNFLVNNGGVRFRSAYNRSEVNGITFQDYINYKADKDTPLTDLPSLYEQGKLKELSKIETEEIKAL